jgi:tetratricopeptide (TPR) repeat protein
VIGFALLPSSLSFSALPSLAATALSLWLSLTLAISSSDGGATAGAAPVADREATPAAGASTGAAAAEPSPSTPAAPRAATRPVATATAQAWHAQALARLKAGRLDEAARLLARALERDPESAVIQTDLGFVLGKLGRRAEAEATLRAAIAREPRRFYAYVNLADLLADDPSRWERRDQIVAFLDRGLEALKDDPKGRLFLLMRLANFERVVGRTAAARARLEPLLVTGKPSGTGMAAAAIPPLSRAQRKRALDLLEAIALDERAQALEDWPTTVPSAADRAEADGAASAMALGRFEEARARLDPLVRRAPDWPRARRLRARALEALGRVDEAVRDLEIAVNLSPSGAEAWRALGRLLATQGGALEADRADQALRNALILEPSWGELRALRAQLARRRAALAPSPVTPRVVAPTERARSLYREAEEWIEVGDPAGLGRDLVEQALAESPGYVAAAVTAYSISGTVSQATADALWDDGPGLWALASGVRELGKAAPGATAAPGMTPAPGTTPATGATGATVAPADRGIDRLTLSWIDRAVALDVQEARFARALARAGAGDRDGALADLVAYIAREPRPVHLAEARALRAGLTRGEGRPSPELLARIRLLEDRPDAALGALGGPCAAGLAGDRLRALGLVHEYRDARSAARRCYELAAEVGDRPALRRLARLDARLPEGELRPIGAAERATLERAAAQGMAAAHWTLARLAAAAGDQEAALAGADRALALVTSSAGGSEASPDAAPGNALVVADRPAGGDRPGDSDRPGAGEIDGDADGALDSWVGAARAARDDLAAARRAADGARRERRRQRAAGAVGLALLLVSVVARRRLAGRTVAAALRRRPALFPEVARAVAEIRHDVLKHRAGVLGMIADPRVERADIRRALAEPQPTSAAVASIYARVAQAARGLGLTLRPLAREPIFGALARDLAQAEASLARAAGPGSPPASVACPRDSSSPEPGARAPTTAADLALLAIDARLRGPHADRLTELLQLGPRTRLDVAELAGWIAAAEAATRRAGAGWAAPALLLGELAVEFPVEREALSAIFANLLRNAQAAVAGSDGARVIIRVDRERDVTGRQLANLFVGDSAAAPLTLEAIEARESGRGLAIVRDLVRQWRGHLVVRAEPAPFTKQVGACFPL